MKVRAAAVFTGSEWLDDHTVEVRDGVVATVRPARIGDPAPLDGALLPGLVNAHTHLELSGSLVPADGLVGWVKALAASGPFDAAAGARAAVDAGTAAVSDISNRGDTVDVLRDAGLAGIVQDGILGFDRDKIDPRIDLARATSGQWGDVVRRPTAHGAYSTAPAVLAAAVSVRGPRASVHAAEHPDELALLRDGTGPFAAFLDALGRDWRWWVPPGESPIAFLDRLRVLRRLLVVHGVHLTDQDRSLLASRGAPLCLCPRSNLHIGGQLPDVPALMGAGVALCLGTDSLASTPDLDLLGEAAVLAEAFPEVPAAAWLWMATEGGATALGLSDHGRIAPGTRPGLLLLDGVRRPEDALQRPTRRWVVAPRSR